MRKAFTAETEATTAELFALVSDLKTYPEWLDVVAAVEDADEPDAWVVTLRARVGPFARSKRLRMVRAELSPQPSEGDVSTVRFERQELDGKEHSAWTMSAQVGALDAPPHHSVVTVDLNYDGAMWAGALDIVLDAAAARAKSKLQTYTRG